MRKGKKGEHHAGRKGVEGGDSIPLTKSETR